MGQNERVVFASNLKKIKREYLYHQPSCEEQLQMFTYNINKLTDKHFLNKESGKTHNSQTMGVG